MSLNMGDSQKQKSSFYTKKKNLWEVRMRTLKKGKFKKTSENVELCRNWGIQEEFLLYCSNMVGWACCWSMFDDCFFFWMNLHFINQTL